jgi:hypothetical protein
MKDRRKRLALSRVLASFPMWCGPARKPRLTGVYSGGTSEAMWMRFGRLRRGWYVPEDRRPWSKAARRSSGMYESRPRWVYVRMYGSAVMAKGYWVCPAQLGRGEGAEAVHRGNAKGGIGNGSEELVRAIPDGGGLGAVVFLSHREWAGVEVTQRALGPGGKARIPRPIDVGIMSEEKHLPAERNRRVRNG